MECEKGKMKLSFKTKAQNLVNLYGRLDYASVLPSIVLDAGNVAQWQLDQITLLGGKVIARSSSFNEDMECCSNAGAFLSFADLNTSDQNELLRGLRQVADSMNNYGEVLVQPMLQNVLMCGVAFSVDKENLAPYFHIEYDESGSTSSITSGENAQRVTSYVFREYEFVEECRISKIIKMIKELEEIFDSSYLDIEFALCFENGEEKLYCLQVRPLVIANKQNLFKQIKHSDLERLAKRIDKLSNIRHGVLGKKKIFGVMPDWNPAEIIGIRPKRLALSLYKEIVTDSIWAYQRKKYGYRDLRSHQLMHSFFGIPFIDVQVSLNSFVPNMLKEDLAEKLVNYYLDLLEENPHLHDKVEFEIVFSCIDFTSVQRMQKLVKKDFSRQEIDEIYASLLDLTNSIISSSNGIYKEDIEKIKIMQDCFSSIINEDISLLDKLYWLLEDCKRYGTLPFAGIARTAFVAMQLLNSLVDSELITLEQKNVFMETLNTVSKQLSKDRFILCKHEFLEKYGHLRAGTYDILSPRYDEDYDRYFGDFIPNNHEERLDFVLSDEQYSKIDKAIKKIGLKISAYELFDFIQTAIEAREHAKFEFTKMLSKAIEIVGKIGEYYNISLEDMAHLDIRDILTLHSTFYCENPRERFENLIAHNKEEYLATCAIKLPPLICRGKEVFCFSSSLVQANFITHLEVVADVSDDGYDLEGKIILIDSADPGYDYLFTKNIAGLITCYGGANSHMAIRCSEIGLPAAIGVGEEKFNHYKLAKRLQLDCLNQKILVLN